MNTSTRPGWPQIGAELVCLSVLALGGGLDLVRLGLDPVWLGLTLTALSGVAGMAAFFAAFGLRIRFWAAAVAGLAASEVFRRSGSIWPAVVMHRVVNLPTIPLMLLTRVAT